MDKPLRRRIISWVAVFLQIMLLTAALSSWWAGRNHTIAGKDRWIAGKNTVKYVFYTYDFLVAPLGKSGINLSDHQGFQEIIYAEPEGPQRRLTRLVSTVAIGRRGYLWVELKKEGLRFMGIRLSRHSGYPGGFFRFGTDGELVEEKGFDTHLPERAGAWETLDISRNGREWEVSLSGRLLGRFSDGGPEGGLLGFRGSGAARSAVLIGKVAMEFQDPTSPGRVWQEEEDFTSPFAGGKLLLAAFILSLAGVSFRCWCKGVFGRHLPPAGRDAFLLADGLFFLLSLAAAAAVCGRFPSGLAIPAALVAAELPGLVYSATCRDGNKRSSAPYAPSLLSAAALMTVLTLIGGISFYRSGDWLWRAERTGPPQLRSVHPDLYDVFPETDESSPPFLSEEDLEILPGKPFFSEGRSYREQIIKAEFSVADGASMDVVFQQQSFTTKGDSDGERFPYRRRLLRISAKDDAPAGMATGERNRPAPFQRLRGDVSPGVKNSLEIRDSGDVTTVILNGEKTIFSGPPYPAFGETGFMAYRGAVVLHGISIIPAGKAAGGGGRPFFAGLIFPLLLATVAWRTLKVLGGIGGVEAFALEGSALFPLAFYLLAASFPDQGALSLLGRDRMAWLDVLLAATFLSHISAVLLLRSRIRYAAVLFNMFLGGLLLSSALLIWDLLPEDHSLRLRMEGEGVVPGDMAGRRKGKDVPWHADMKAIGANLYTWEQKFGGEAIEVPKPPGEIRVMVAGGSQAWGAGAEDSAATWAELLEQRLLAVGKPVQVYNASVNGAGIKQIAKTYQGLLRRFEPDLLILDVGLNDSAALRMKKESRREKAAAALAETFASLADACRRDGTEVILVLEPMSSETPLRRAAGYYEALTEAAIERDIPVLDPQPLLREKEKRHQVWWDTAHFTPYGHSLMAGFLESETVRALSDAEMISPSKGKKD